MTTLRLLFASSSGLPSAAYNKRGNDPAYTPDADNTSCDFMPRKNGVYATCQSYYGDEKCKDLPESGFFKLIFIMSYSRVDNFVFDRMPVLSFSFKSPQYSLGVPWTDLFIFPKGVRRRQWTGEILLEEMIGPGDANIQIAFSGGRELDWPVGNSESDI